MQPFAVAADLGRPNWGPRLDTIGVLLDAVGSVLRIPE